MSPEQLHQSEPNIEDQRKLLSQIQHENSHRLSEAGLLDKVNKIYTNRILDRQNSTGHIPPEGQRLVSAGRMRRDINELVALNDPNNYGVNRQVVGSTEYFAVSFNAIDLILVGRLEIDKDGLVEIIPEEGFSEDDTTLVQEMAQKFEQLQASGDLPDLVSMQWIYNPVKENGDKNQKMDQKEVNEIFATHPDIKTEKSREKLANQDESPLIKEIDAIPENSHTVITYGEEETSERLVLSRNSEGDFEAIVNDSGKGIEKPVTIMVLGSVKSPELSSRVDLMDPDNIIIGNYLKIGRKILFRDGSEKHVPNQFKYFTNPDNLDSQIIDQNIRMGKMMRNSDGLLYWLAVDDVRTIGPLKSFETVAND